ncbi:SusC/RagA family TonB-linked outer membrane protein [Sphingobacterium sp. SGG-5]|uniref:SusC/RagA family TonB-linked outer membrane protein n=1 Tax=Sphingobacterium sp. SGG-5 TaxID=2710881 RepID=UPI0013EAFE7C|nr:SusC/RagA family TonB-linked outer membrane protein [Sphingobacterium sp. SGG-5]NGM62164.1 SusC/RagA family TonB-linked outer membrane protein [Sphingobacterium sp. SGG-5]
MKQLYLYVFTIVTLVHPYVLSAADFIPLRKTGIDRLVIQDSTETETDSVVIYNADPTKAYLGTDSVNLSTIGRMPNVTLHQMLKGQTSGVYVQETSGEPGTVQQGTLIRGISHPVLNPYDVAKNKPLILLNGIPLIEDPSIVYDIQDYTLQPVGAATSIQSIFDAENIESIHVLKDYSTTAIYGPRAVNGVIYITTKNAEPGERKLSLSGYSGFAVPQSVNTINADWEKNFRQPYYDRYATPDQQAAYPAYLSDSSNVNFYGPSNWTDLYYNVAPLYSINGSLIGGGERSNFRFYAGHTSNTGAADDTYLKRYQGAFYINMLPTRWMTISSMLHMTRLDRGRNRSISERLGETRFIPDMTTPLSPNKEMYGQFISEYDKVIDDNINSSLIGQIAINFAILKNLNFSPRFSIDYNENKRNVFWPSTLMSGNNYVSNYLGYNERMVFDNTLTYDHLFADNSNLLFEAGMSYQSDAQKYNYGVGYKGPNDFIKVNIVEGNSQKGEYLRAVGFIPYYYSDRIYHRMASVYGRATYGQAGRYKIGALVRRDGSSQVQPTDRWYTSYAVNGEYDLNYHVQSDIFDQIKVAASYGQMGNIPFSDRESAGPQYTSGLGWEGNKAVFSYNGIGTINRPYSSGWVGYDLPWSYTDMANISLELGVLKQLSIRAEYYNKHTKESLFAVPTVAESGYKFNILNGMAVRNTGVDLTLDYTLAPSTSSKFGWSSSLNIGYNNNELTALPNDLQEIIVGNRKLVVGERIDRFFLLKNEGVYVNDIDVPVDPNNYKILTYNGGTPLKGGDPRWVDVNGDYNIDNTDRQLMGNILPKYVGGFYNQFTYGRLDLSFQLYFNLGREIINQQAARYFDFANMDESSTITGVRDITFWEQNFDDQDYPLYNPWSSVTPYQAEQDMFMEDGSFIKLRNLSLGYDLTQVVNGKRQTFDRFYVYVSGNNLLTYTKYSGRDPELVDFYGYDTGMGIRIPRTFTLGVKLDF